MTDTTIAWPRPPLPGLLLEKNGRPIANMADWLERAGPVGKSGHWKPYRSAKELARAWFGAEESKVAAMPIQLRDLLTSHPRFADLETFRAIPEHKIPLDEFKGNTRNTDLVIVCDGPTHRAVISVEAKATEPFDRTIADRARAAARLRVRKPQSRAAERIERLARGVLGCDVNDCGPLRYQLLHATAAALIAARMAGAADALLLIHEFRKEGERTSEHDANNADLRAFVERLGMDFDGEGIHGPVHVPGNERVPSAIPLYAAKIVTHLRSGLE